MNEHSSPLPPEDLGAALAVHEAYETVATYDRQLEQTAAVDALVDTIVYRDLDALAGLEMAINAIETDTVRRSQEKLLPAVIQTVGLGLKTLGITAFAGFIGSLAGQGKRP